MPKQRSLVVSRTGEDPFPCHVEGTMALCRTFRWDSLFSIVQTSLIDFCISAKQIFDLPHHSSVHLYAPAIS